MFENLTERLTHTIKRLRGQGRLSDDNIKETLREVRMALLEADVSLPVVKQFVERVRERAVGQEVMQSLTPGQALVKIVNDELVSIMGEACDELQLNVQPPAVVLMAGLQGSGKTTSTAKLARWLRERKKKSVLVTSCDIYRPAAIHQLEKLAGEVEADFFPSTTEDDPVAIAKASLDHARRKHLDVLIVDAVAPGGQASTSSKIENYLGFPKGISGADLVLEILGREHRLRLPLVGKHNALNAACALAASLAGACRSSQPEQAPSAAAVRTEAAEPTWIGEPLSWEKLDAIERWLVDTGEQEVTSARLGEHVLLQPAIDLAGHGDALDIDPASALTPPVRIVANLPKPSADGVARWTVSGSNPVTRWSSRQLEPG